MLVLLLRLLLMLLLLLLELYFSLRELLALPQGRLFTHVMGRGVGRKGCVPTKAGSFLTTVTEMRGLRAPILEYTHLTLPTISAV